MQTFKNKRIRQDVIKKNIFVWSILFYPMLCFVIFYVGVNINSFIMAFQKRDIYGNSIWYGLENFRMFISMIIGIVVGVIMEQIGKTLPSVCTEIISVAGACMSPVAMLLTGMTIAKLDLVQLIKKWRIYLLSFFKLLVFPLLYIGVFAFVPQSSFINETVLVCGMCVMCMPTGLNTIVIPAGYGKDTSDAAGMALITHLLSVITIPLMFMLFNAVVI